MPILTNLLYMTAKHHFLQAWPPPQAGWREE
jgi:hypothetical protein